MYVEFPTWQCWMLLVPIICRVPNAQIHLVHVGFLTLCSFFLHVEFLMCRHHTACFKPTAMVRIEKVCDCPLEPCNIALKYKLYWCLFVRNISHKQSQTNIRKYWLCGNILCVHYTTTTTTTVLRPFFRNHPGELVPEENFWTVWCKGRLTETNTPTIQLGATPSELSSAHLHHPPFFYRLDALPAAQPTTQ